MTSKQNRLRRSSFLLGALLCAEGSSAFSVHQKALSSHRHSSIHPRHRLTKSQARQSLYLPNTSLKASVSSAQEEVFDGLLEKMDLKQAVDHFRTHPDMELTKDRWGKIFDTIEEVTAEAEQSAINTRQEQEVPLLSKSRLEMTEMYQTLKEQGHLQLFGAIDQENMPANGSRTVRPNMLEQISLLSMKALTPQPSNTLLYAGAALAVAEGIASVSLGVNLNFLFLLTLMAGLSDRILLNGALSETILKILKPETQPKITRHEAGHFLCAYLLGCPVEGYVLSAWAALQDARFGTRAVSAGTSFFDPALSTQISSGKVTRSSIDRYSIVVMAGIAAEAVQYGRADGGAGDEMALIAFLTNLNGGFGNTNPAWNDVTIRNQARWGALQAVLLLREYQDCYEALVDALERGGSLGDCIYAIENTARSTNKLPLSKPLGYILERSGGYEEEWVTKLPEGEAQQESSTAASMQPTKPKPAPLDPEASLEALRDYKEEVQAKLRDLDSKLENL